MHVPFSYASLLHAWEAIGQSDWIGEFGVVAGLGLLMA
jgi:hypothetical protein